MEEILANVWQTIAMVFKPVTNLFSWTFAVLQDIWNLFNRFFSALVSVIKFLVDAIKFIWYSISTIFNYLVKAFDNIFSDWLFDPISVWFNNLSVYIWSGRTVVFISLLVVVFFIIIYWFIMRILKWQVNYNATVKRLWKSKK